MNKSYISFGLSQSVRHALHIIENPVVYDLLQSNMHMDCMLKCIFWLYLFECRPGVKS